MSYAVIFRGELRPGVQRAQAQAAMARLFGLADAAQLDSYFSGAEAVIKAGLAADAAEKYRQALEQAGLLVELRDQSAPAPSVGFMKAAASQAEERIWWIKRGGKEFGPYTKDEVIGMAAANQVQEHDGIWRQGMPFPLAPTDLTWLRLPTVSPGGPVSVSGVMPQLAPSGGQPLLGKAMAAGLILALLGLAGAGVWYFKGRGGGQISRADLEMVATQLNDSLPRMVDDKTRLDHIEVFDRTLVYRYSLPSTRADAIDARQFRSGLSTSARARICGDSDSQALLRRGVSYHFVYISSDMQSLGEQDVEPADCGISPAS